MYFLISEPLDDLETIVVPKFKDIVDKGAHIPTFPEHPYGPNELGVGVLKIILMQIKSIILKYLSIR